ncbi:hypothetical protein [Enterococcus sp. DIV0756]|uniref:hypothetical protein n=1 Tax=Enterococcus sp. DIV0756 TaxID=2774636 RepID=UPI003F1E7E85
MGFKSIEVDSLNETECSQLISRNLLSNSWWTNGLNHWSNTCGEIAIDEDEYGYMNLTMDSHVSVHVQQNVTLKENHCYFISFDVKVTRYVSGLFGIHMNGRFISGNSSLGVRRQTKNKDYETIVGVLKTGNFPSQEYNLLVGGIGTANGTGSIRKLSVYDLTAVYGSESEPTAEVFFDAIPDTQDEFGISLTNRQLFAALDKKLNKLARKNIGVSDREAHIAFIEEMNRKAKMIGMFSTNFENMHGFKAEGQVTTANDFLKLGLKVLGHSEIIQAWGAEEYTVFIYGKNEREERIRTTLHSSLLEEKYTILGGKTGTIGKEILDVITLIEDENSDLYLTVVMGASGETGNSDRFEAVDQLISSYKQELIDSKYHISTFVASSGFVLKVPPGNPHYYSKKLPNSIFSINGNEQVVPAGMSKVMTALLLIENVSNLNETGIILASDITGGSGPKLFEGDQISFRDALYLLLLPSSNTAAKFISREVGYRIIQTKGYIS